MLRLLAAAMIVLSASSLGFAMAEPSLPAPAAAVAAVCPDGAGVRRDQVPPDPPSPGPGGSGQSNAQPICWPALRRPGGRSGRSRRAGAALGPGNSGKTARPGFGARRLRPPENLMESWGTATLSSREGAADLHLEQLRHLELEAEHPGLPMKDLALPGRVFGPGAGIDPALTGEGNGSGISDVNLLFRLGRYRYFDHGLFPRGPDPGGQKRTGAAPDLAGVVIVMMFVVNMIGRLFNAVRTIWVTIY